MGEAKVLRALADCDGRAGEPLGKAMRSAADEIERLEAELREARDILDRHREQFCEGFCDGKGDGFYLPEMDVDCSACRARAFNAKVQP